MMLFFKIEIINNDDILKYEYIAQDRADALQEFYKLKNDNEIIKKYDKCIMQLLQINEDQTYNIVKITNILNKPNQTAQHSHIKSTNTSIILLITIYILILPILLVKSAVKASK